MTRAELQKSRSLWRSREIAALRTWRYRQKRLTVDNPRRAEAFQAYRKAHAMRVRRDKQLARLPIIHMSPAGRRALIREEGVRRFAYNDSRGFSTFGVGHLIATRPVNDHDRRAWGTPSHPLSMRVVDATLARDLTRFEAAVRDVYEGSPLKPTQGEFDALVSLAFNIGVGGFMASTVAKRIKAGDRAGAARAIMLWDRPPELRGRRDRERRMFLA